MTQRPFKALFGVWLVSGGIAAAFTFSAFGQQDTSADSDPELPTMDDCVLMLSDQDPSVRAKGVRGLSAAGTFDCMAELSGRLRDDDADVRRLTEQAMWQVWFRSGSEKADGLLQASMQAIREHRFDEALKTLEATLEIVPDFAEAYNQRAIVHYFRHQYAQSIKDCHEVIQRNPYHFGALSGMGQCYQHLHKPDEAIKVYERALRVNPNMEGVRKTLIRLLDADGQAIQA